MKKGRNYKKPTIGVRDFLLKEEVWGLIISAMMIGKISIPVKDLMLIGTKNETYCVLLI